MDPYNTEAWTEAEAYSSLDVAHLTTVTIIYSTTNKSSCKLTVNSFKLSDLRQQSTKHTLFCEPRTWWLGQRENLLLVGESPYFWVVFAVLEHSVPERKYAPLFQVDFALLPLREGGGQSLFVLRI